MRKHTLFAAVFLLLIILSFRNAPPIPVHTADAKIAPGESLFHGLPDKHPPEGMPLVPLLSGILTNHASAAQRSVLLSFAFVFFVLAVSALSAILQNRVQGLAAFALLSSIWIFNTGMGALDLEQLLYAGTVAAFAACFVWAARSPSGLNWGIAGISLALTLAVKSSLLMLAPLLAVFPLLPFLKRLPSPRPRNYAVFFAGPLIIAAGWSCVNYAVYNKPVMMETRRAHSNVITGALGLISTIEGNPYRLAGISPDANILAWAAKEVVRYPVRYLKAVSHRIYFILSGHWLLLLAGLCGFWIFRLDAGFRALAVLELYFLLAHCAMAVEERYFIAFWALLVPAAVAPFNGLIGLIRRNARPAEPARLTAMLAFLPFTALCLFAVSLTAIYPARVKTSRLDKQALAGAISENPKDPWLLARLGQLRLKAGETAAAIDLLGRAFQLSGRRSYGADYALALLAGGNRKALSEFLSGNDLGYEGTIISMFSEIKAASYLGAAKLYKSAETAQRSRECLLRKTYNDYEAGVYARLLKTDNTFKTARIGDLLKPLPTGERISLMEKFAKVPIDAEELENELALELQNSGDDAGAGRIFSRLTVSHPDNCEYQKGLEQTTPDPSNSEFLRALELQNSGKYAAAGRILDSLTTAHPDNCAYQNAAGVISYLAGDLVKASETLKDSIKKHPDYLPPYLTLGTIYSRIGKPHEAGIIYASALERCFHPSDLCAAIKAARSGLPGTPRP